MQALSERQVRARGLQVLAGDSGLDGFTPGEGWDYAPGTVRVAAGRRGTDEGGREGLVGIASPALGSAGCLGGLGYSIHYPSYTGLSRI